MNAIEISNLSKSFRINDFRTSLIQSILSRKDMDRYNRFSALNNLNFTVKKGDTLGVIGPNGSGKTTLLKIIANILRPDHGEVNVSGTVNLFLRLGIGFQMELTAKENIYLYGALLGLRRDYINKIFDNIISFSELNDFVYMKLKHFSTGMLTRLAFSTAIQAQSDILLLDEILAVGDIAFQKKCLDTMTDFKKQGRTIVFVSHSLETIEEFCTNTLYLDKGEQIDYGPTNEVINSYKLSICL